MAAHLVSSEKDGWLQFEVPTYDWVNKMACAHLAMLKSMHAPSNCLCIALLPNADYAGLATCCATLQIIQPLPSITLKQAVKDPEALSTHIEQCSLVQHIGLDFNGIEEITRDHQIWHCFVKLVSSRSSLARD